MIPPVKAELSPKPKKLMECVRDELRLRNYSYRTEETYCQWITRFLKFHLDQNGGMKPRDFLIKKRQEFLPAVCEMI